MNSNEKHQLAVEQVIAELNRDSNIEATEASKKGFDIELTYKDTRNRAYICVVKMLEPDESSNSSPYSSVNPVKWRFAINHPDQYYFVIALEQRDGQFKNTIYSVEDFWKMTSKPQLQLYCFRNRAKAHTILSQWSSNLSSQNQENLNRIKNSINKLWEFKKSL